MGHFYYFNDIYYTLKFTHHMVQLSLNLTLVRVPLTYRGCHLWTNSHFLACCTANSCTQMSYTRM